MRPELAMPSEIARAGSFWRSRRLHAFLLASLAAHAGIIIGLPDFLPRFDVPSPGALEVTILAPQPVSAPVTAPKPSEAQRPDEPIAKGPRPQSDKKPVQAARQATGGGPAAVPAARGPDTEIVDSSPVAPSKGASPLAQVPDPAPGAAPPVTPPSFDAAYLSNPPPPYPQAARRAGQQGTVTLRVLVLRSGQPSRVELEKSSGSSLLDVAAQDAVRGWRFVPARHGSDPVESWVLVPVVFRLEGAR